MLHFRLETAPAIRIKSQILERIERLERTQWPAQRVLYLIWREPWMTVARDTYISRMLDVVGWHTWPEVPSDEKGASRYPQLSGTEPWLASIERVLLSSEPYRFGAQHVQEVRAWLPQASVQLVDGELLSWYGSRAVRGLGYLAELAGGADSAAKASAGSAA